MTTWAWIIFALHLLSCSSAPPARKRALKNFSNPPPQETPDPDPDPDHSDDSSSNARLVFEKEVFPLLSQWCERCHGAINAPYFAQQDIKKAHDELLQSAKVDLKNPDKSRIYIKLAKEQHNCPTPRCDEAGGELLTAVKKWASASGSEVDKNGQATRTSALGFKDIEGPFEDLAVPKDSVSLQAESGTVRSPMIVKSEAGAQDNQVVEIPAGTPNRLGESAATASTLGAVSYRFSVPRQGRYRIVGRVRGRATPSSSFYLRIDGGALIVWALPDTRGKLAFDVARTALNAPDPTTVPLSAGQHTIDLLQREADSACDMLYLVPDETITPQSIPSLQRQLRTMTFDLGSLSGISGARLKVDIGLFGSDGSYILKNPRISLPSGSIRVKGLKLLINDKFDPTHSTFLTIDQTVTPPGDSLSKSALVAIKDLGQEKDLFSFGFGLLEGKP